MALTGTIKFTVASTLTESRDLGEAEVNETLTKTILLTDGTGLNQATQCFGDSRTLSASTSEDLDLNGSLTNGLGESVTFTRIVAIAIFADPSNGDVLNVGGAAANQFYPMFDAADNEFKIGPGGFLLFGRPDATGYPVTAGTADILKIENADSGDSASYDIIIIGSEA